MSVNFASYQIARSGMFVSERGLDVTGHNISNVNTTGYVRQQAMISSAHYYSAPGNNGTLQYGLGADIEQIRQIRHSFLDNIYRQENTSLGYWQARDKTLQDVQSILGEPMGAGLQDVMNQFWDSWQELSKEPDSLTVRALVRQRGDVLTQQINHVGSQLDSLQEDLNSEIKVRVDDINDITKQIAGLNLKITEVEISGDTANDYRDQRNLLVDKLSNLVDADITEMQDGQLSVTVGGYSLVNRGDSTQLYAGESTPGSVFYVPKLQNTNIEVPLKEGSLKGLLESRGEVNGAMGSTENGTPNTKVDITFAVDVSQGSAAYLNKLTTAANPPADMESPIQKYIDDLNKRGLDYNLRLVSFDGTGAVQTGNYGSDSAAFVAGVNSLTETANTGSDFGSVVSTLDGITDFRPDAEKCAIVLTPESIGGDSTAAITAVQRDAYISTLTAKNIKVSVVTDSSYFDSGDTAAGETVGWGDITGATGGTLHDIDIGGTSVATADFSALVQDINNGTKNIVNGDMSDIQASNNIISDLRKKLNALINVMCREVNYLQRSGKTLGTNAVDGQDFFTAINTGRPMEMGNIKLNDNLQDLSNIVASTSGSSGDNTIALKIANLRYNSLLKDEDGIHSIDDYYQAIILEVGNNGQKADNVMQNQQNLVNSADQYRQSITGVSMDEEMTNMMKYKFAYDASSRVINVVDQMTETIVEKMGLVGR